MPDDRTILESGELKEMVTAFFEPTPHLERDARRIWWGDAKEMDYTMVMAQ